MTDNRNGEDYLDDYAKQLAESIEKAVQERTAGYEAKVNEMSKHLEDIKTALAEREKAMAAMSMPGVEVARKGERDAFSWYRASQAIVEKDWGNAPYEKEVFDATKNKAYGTYLDSQAGYLVPEEVTADIIELYRSRLIFTGGDGQGQIRTTEMNGLSASPVKLRKHTAASTSGWIGESQSMTDSTATLGQLELTPKKAYGLSYLSNELSFMSVPDADMWISREIGETLAQRVQTGLLNGTGGMQPVGIRSLAGNNSAISGTPTYNELEDFVASIRNDDALRGSLAWLASPQQLSSIIKMPDPGTPGSDNFSDQPMARRLIDTLHGGMLGPGQPTLMGYPIYTTTNGMNTTAGGAGALLFGDWSQVVRAQWGNGIFLAKSEHHRFQTDELAIRATILVDVNLRQDNALCVNT